MAKPELTLIKLDANAATLFEYLGGRKPGKKRLTRLADLVDKIIHPPADCSMWLNGWNTMSDQIEPVLREFEDALADFFAGGQRDATRLYDARMRLYSHPEFAFVSDDYEKAVARAHAAGMVAWRLARPLSLPIMGVGIAIVMWDFAREQMMAILSNMRLESIAIRGVEKLDPALEGEIAQKRRLVDQAFRTLTAAEIAWLHRMSVGARPVGMPGHVGNSLGNAGLLEYDFTGITGIRSELKPFVDEKLKEYRAGSVAETI